MLVDFVDEVLALTIKIALNCINRVEVMQRYSNLDSVSKIFQKLCADGLITPDGRPIPRSDRSTNLDRLPEPFKLDQRLKPAVVTEIVARYESGESSTSLGATFKLNKNSVVKLLREAGVPIRRQPLTEGQAHEAARLYEGRER